jgi:hypothetical protein
MNNKQAKRLRKIIREQNLQEDLLVRSEKGVVTLIPDCARAHYRLLKRTYKMLPSSFRAAFLRKMESV